MTGNWLKNDLGFNDGTLFAGVNAMIIGGKWILAISILLLGSDAAAQRLRVIQEWRSGPTHAGLNLKWPNQSLTTIGTKTYVVWVDSKNVVKVSCLDRSKDPLAEQTVTFDDAYPGPRDDGHHGFTIGISSDGYIHVSGDMHHHPRHNTDHLNEHPRYRNARILYWVSRKPYDISTFAFAGDNDNLAPTGYGFSYMHFRKSKTGTLYFNARSYSNPDVGSYVGGWKPGVIGMGICKYDPTTRRWLALGAPVPTAYGNLKLVAWEAYGHRGSAYQNYNYHMFFGRHDRMHLAFAINGDNSTNEPIRGGEGGQTHVCYAYSDDGGETFHRADGSPITLPMGSDPGARQADIVHRHHWLWGKIRVAADSRERPIVAFTHSNNSRDASFWTKWTGSEWRDPIPALRNTRYQNLITDATGTVYAESSSGPSIDGPFTEIEMQGTPRHWSEYHLSVTNEPIFAQMLGNPRSVSISRIERVAPPAQRP